jgi:C_GCAxxG_C_C family probable redox protein
MLRESRREQSHFIGGKQANYWKGRTVNGGRSAGNGTGRLLLGILRALQIRRQGDVPPTYFRLTTTGEITVSKAEQAAEFMRGGFNCAQSVVKAFGSELDAQEDAVVGMASGFGGGVGRTGEICGALTGAALVLGARFGHADPAETGKRETTYAAVQKLLDAFRKEHGTVLCRELIGADMRDPEALARARAEGVFSRKCPMLVESSARILGEILQSE